MWRRCMVQRSRADDVMVTWWCSHHEALVSAEHWFQCRFTRPPQAIHFHPVRSECVVASWAEIATLLCAPDDSRLPSGFSGGSQREWRAEYQNEPVLRAGETSP